MDQKENFGDGDIANQPKQKPKSAWLWLLVGVVIVIIVGVVILLRGNEDNSTSDKNGGIENATSGDEKTVKSTSTDKSDEPIYSSTENQWSKMDQGPYKDKVSFATSGNLLNWTDSGQVLAEHASVPDVVYKDGVLYAYFVDVSTNGYPEKIGMVKSTDSGKTWTSREFVTIQGIGQKAPADPSPILLSDGRIRLFYFDILEGRNAKGRKTTNKIYSAISTDGVNFTEEDGVRFEYDGIFDPDIIKVSDNLWRMYVGNMDGSKVYSATSTDGMTFTYEGIAYSGGAIPNVIFENGKYYLFTGGIDISTSVDGKIFARTTNRFDSGKLTADPGVIKLPDGTYLMVYKTSDKKPGSM